MVIDLCQFLNDLPNLDLGLDLDFGDENFLATTTTALKQLQQQRQKTFGPIIILTKMQIMLWHIV